MATNPPIHRPTFYPDERVDLIDFVDAIVYGQLEGVRQQNVIFEPASHDYALVFEGFALSIFGGGTGVSVDLSGTPAIFGTEARDGNLHPGRICGSEQGITTQELLVTNFTPPPVGASTYDLYVRLGYQLGNSENRLFWDRTSNQEVSLLTNTRAQAYYTLTAVVNGAPNPYTGQAYKLGEVTVDGALNVTSVVGTRIFYFEEGEANDFAATGWGDGANDRNDTREADGVEDLNTHVKMVRRQLADIMGEDDPGAFPAASTKKPWGVVLNSLPSLYTLLQGHWESGHADAGSHKGFQIKGNPATYQNFIIFNDTTGPVPSATIVHGDDGAVSDLGGNLLIGGFTGPAFPQVDGFTLRVVCQGAATAGGIIIGHGDGIIDRDLDPLEEAHLRFGNTGKVAGWKTTQDYALVAVGGATDDLKELRIEVGAAQVGAWMNGGDFRLKSGKEYGYLTDREFLRCFNASDFRLKDGSAHSASGLMVSDTSMDGAGGITDQWFLVLNDISGGLSPVDGWALVDPSGSNIPGGTLEPDHLLAGSAWMASGMKITIGDECKLDCEFNTNYIANNGALQLLLCRMSNGIWEQIAYAQIAVTTTTRGRRAGNWTAAGAWPGGTEYALDLSSYTYGLMIVPYHTGGAGDAITGQVAVYGATVAFRVKEKFGH